MRTSALLILMALVSSSAIAVEVTIEWQQAPGAYHYDLRVKRGKEIVRSETFPSRTTRWTADLPFGVYAYELRTLDRKGRRSAWSDPTPFFVTPAPPQLVQPAADSSVLSRSGGAVVSFQWSPSPGVQRYLVEVRGQSASVRKVVTGTQLSLHELKPGAYQWNVKAVIDGERETASSVQSTLAVKPSDTWGFRVDSITDSVASSSAREIIDLSAGVVAGTNYFFPDLHGQVRLGRNFGLGVRALLASDAAGSATLKAFAALATVAWYPWRGAFSGPYFEAGAGAYWFTGESATLVQHRTAASGYLLAGWQWFPGATGVHVGAGVGVQYVQPVDLTVIQSKVKDVLPLVMLSIGWAY